MITLSGAMKRYSSDVVIGPVDLEIPAGGITALVGPNGAGKSTLLTMMGRLLRLDEGHIRIGGFDVSATASSELARVVSILRQENHFVARLTVRQLVALGRFPYSRGRLTSADESAVSAAIDFMDLATLEDRFLDQLSGGQRQRAYVAMVLAQDTDYLLLDEPLNNLDMRHSVLMMQQARRAADELGRTIVVVLHDLNFAAAYADRVIAMRDGQVVSDGSVTETMHVDILESVYNTPVGIHWLDGRPVASYWRPQLDDYDRLT